MSNLIYVDNNATTQVSKEVLDAMLPYFKDKYGNPSSLHSFGGEVKKDIDRARDKIAQFIGAKSSEIYFTSCGTESDNTALMGAIKANPNKKKIITSKVEHPAVKNVCEEWGRLGYNVVEIGVDLNGAINMEELENSLSDDVAIVSIMWANNETGVLFPIDKIAKLVKSRGIIFHTDAVQAVGKVPIDVSKVPVDMLSLSGHKIHAPKGVGVLYVREGVKINPLLLGGHQESGLRAGTENVPYIVGLGKACEILNEDFDIRTKKIEKLRNRLESEIVKLCPDTNVNGKGQARLCNTANISFQFIEGESMLLLLNEKGICASSGSACSSGSLEPSHVLRAMNMSFTKIHGSIRFSLSHYNTDEDIDYVIKHMPPIVERLRSISPFV